MKKAVEIFVGIDISKAWLDVAAQEQEEVFRARSDDAGIASLVERLMKMKRMDSPLC
jgi:transposase